MQGQSDRQPARASGRRLLRKCQKDLLSWLPHRTVDPGWGDRQAAAAWDTHVYGTSLDGGTDSAARKESARNRVQWAFCVQNVHPYVLCLAQTFTGSGWGYLSFFLFIWRYLVWFFCMMKELYHLFF